MKRPLMFAIALLLSFALFSKYVKQGHMRAFDFSVTVKVQDKVQAITGSRFDEFFEDIGFFASPMISAIVVLAVTGWSFIHAKGIKKKIAILLIPLAFGLLTLAEVYGKNVVHHPAPPYFMLKNPTSIFPKYYVNEQYSYPSGHTARAVFVAILVSNVMYHVSGKNKRKKQIILLGVIAYVFLVSLGKVYLGQHWFSDVIGGLLVGSAIGVPIWGFL